MSACRLQADKFQNNFMKIRKPFLLMAALTLCASVTVPAVSVRSFAEGGEYVKLESAESGVVQPAVTILEIKSREDLALSRKGTVNIVLVSIDEQLNVVSGSETICAVSQLENELKTSTILGFEIADEATLDALIKYLKDNELTDVFLVVKDSELLYKARHKFSIARGVLDLRGRTELSASETVKLVNEGFSKIVILDAEPLTVDFVDAVRKRYVSVWAADEAPTKKSAAKTILTGVNGVLTNSVSTYTDCYAETFGKGTSLVRKSFTIGHRGSGATEGGYSVYGPENTLKVAEGVFRRGGLYRNRRTFYVG